MSVRGGLSKPPVKLRHVWAISSKTMQLTLNGGVDHKGRLSRVHCTPEKQCIADRIITRSEKIYINFLYILTLKSCMELKSMITWIKDELLHHYILLHRVLYHTGSDLSAPLHSLIPTLPAACRYLRRSLIDISTRTQWCPWAVGI